MSDTNLLNLNFRPSETENNSKFIANAALLEENENLPNEINRVNVGDLSYNEFFWCHMTDNIPVIIEGTAEGWPCRSTWINQKTQRINFEFLKRNISNLKVPVANCSIGYYNSHKKCTMDFHEYLTYWERQQNEKTSRTDINMNADECLESSDGDRGNILYLKDWHLKMNMPDYNFYKVPRFFASDWLNEYLTDKGHDDYRFVYMGPKGSWTPFHADVFSSFSWSTNVYGLKKWIFILPNEESKLKDSLGNDPFEINEKLLREKQVKHFTVIQNENESIFVPSKWYHQVWNLTDTISINHNWFNGCNIQIIWKCLHDNMKKVRDEISDCKDMDNFDEHCQVMLKASFGMNYDDFLNILEHIGRKRLKYLKEQENLRIFDEYKMNEYHVIFDLKKILELCKIMIQNDMFIRDNQELNFQCENLCNMCALESTIS